MFRRAAVVAMLSGLALGGSSRVSLGAAPQPPAGVPPASLERIRDQLNKSPATIRLEVPRWRPLPTFKSGVEQRVYVLTLQEQLRKDFALTSLQRQSADWASKCCGFNVNLLFDSAERALQRRQLRKIRQQIARELAQLEAARAW
jgi:hypothetical protein